MIMVAWAGLNEQQGICEGLMTEMVLCVKSLTDQSEE